MKSEKGTHRGTHTMLSVSRSARHFSVPDGLLLLRVPLPHWCAGFCPGRMDRACCLSSTPSMRVDQIPALRGGLSILVRETESRGESQGTHRNAISDVCYPENSRFSWKSVGRDQFRARDEKGFSGDGSRGVHDGKNIPDGGNGRRLPSPCSPAKLRVPAAGTPSARERDLGQRRERERGRMLGSQ